VIFGSLFVWGISLPVWQIKNIEVAGANITPADEVLKIAGGFKGENIFLFRNKSIINTIKKYSSVKNVIVRKHIPQTLVIQVVERKPFAIVAFRTKSVIIDNDGYIICETSRAKNIDISNLPVINNLSEDSIVKNHNIEKNTVAAIEKSISVISKVLETKKIQLNLESDNINLVVDDVMKIKIGSHDDIDKKLNILKSILANIGHKKNSVVYIDLRVVDNPVLKYR